MNGYYDLYSKIYLMEEKPERSEPEYIDKESDKPSEKPIQSSLTSDIDPPKPKKTRCEVCDKKLTIVTQFKCRCEGLFCNIHRYTDKHDCTFDYKEFGRKKIEQNNPLIKNDKINNRI